MTNFSISDESTMTIEPAMNMTTTKYDELKTTTEEPTAVETMPPEGSTDVMDALATTLETPTDNVPTEEVVTDVVTTTDQLSADVAMAETNAVEVSTNTYEAEDNCENECFTEI